MTTNSSYFTPKDLCELKQPLSINISNNRKHAVLTVELVEDKKRFSHLWLVKLSEGTNIQLTTGAYTDFSPCFSPDSSRIAFVSKREEMTQIRCIRLDGGESWSIEEFPGEIGGLEWIDEEILLLSYRAEDGRQKQAREAKQRGENPTPTHYLIDRIFFKDQSGRIFPDTRYQICTFDIASKEMRQLTHGEYDCAAPRLSPDGTTVFFASNRQPQDQNWDFLRWDIWKVPVSGGEIERVFDWQGEANCPQISPDGRYLAFAGTESISYGLTDNTDIFLFDLRRADSPVNLTASLDRSFFNFSVNDTWGLPRSLNIQWSEDSKKLYSVCTDAGNSPLVEIDVTSKKSRRITTYNGVVLDFAISSTKGAMLFSDPHSPGKIFSLATTKSKLRVGKELRVDFNPWLANKIFSTAEPIKATSPHGGEIQGWVLKPTNFDPKKSYPGVLYVHGGPIAQYCNAFFHEFQYLAAQGYFVLYCNPHGSHGYGKKFCQKLNRDWGHTALVDLLAFVDEAIAKYAALDNERLGIAGGSYGGYMAAWATAHSNRFRAAIAQRGVYNMISLCGTSDFNVMFRIYFQEPYPVISSPDLLWEMSPLKHVAKISTPTLVIHSEDDHRAPIEQAEQFYIALKAVGVDTKFARFPESNHELSRGGRIDRRIIRLELIRDWLQYCLCDGDKNE